MNKRLQAELDKARVAAQIADAKAAGAWAVVRSLERSAGAPDSEDQADALVKAHGQGQEQALANVAKMLGCGASIGEVETTITSLRTMMRIHDESAPLAEAEDFRIRGVLNETEEKLAEAREELARERKGRSEDVAALEAQLAEEREGWAKRLEALAKGKPAAPAKPAKAAKLRRPCDVPGVSEGMTGLEPSDMETSWADVGRKMGRQDELDGLPYVDERYMHASEMALSEGGEDVPPLTDAERADFRRGLAEGAAEAKAWRMAQPDPKNPRSWAVPPWLVPSAPPAPEPKKKRGTQQKLVE